MPIKPISLRETVVRVLNVHPAEVDSAAIVECVQLGDKIELALLTEVDRLSYVSEGGAGINDLAEEVYAFMAAAVVPRFVIVCDYEVSVSEGGDITKIGGKKRSSKLFDLLLDCLWRIMQTADLRQMLIDDGGQHLSILVIRDGRVVDNKQITGRRLVHKIRQRLEAIPKLD